MNTKRNTMAGRYFSLYDTQLGSGSVVASEAGLIEVLLPFERVTAEQMQAQIKKIYPAAVGGNGVTKTAAELLTRYFAGERVEFTIQIDKSAFTPFQSRVYDAVSAIPYGRVKSYAQIAAEIGCPGAARGIGTAMARNPLPIIIPCHRVVGASRALTGYSAAGGIDSKRILLVMEGLTVDEKGRVTMING